MREIGVHVRLQGTISSVITKASALSIPFFQSFFIDQLSRRFVHITDDEIKDFMRLRSSFTTLFLHASYLTNFASITDISLYFFKKEMRLAKRLGFNYIVIHPGFARGAVSKMEGIDAFVQRLNHIIKDEHDIKIVIENAAHGHMSVGADLHELRLILEKISYPEKILFCLDTAHAHVFGYNITTKQHKDLFFNTVKDTIGFERIALVHLNNTDQKMGSNIDKHVLLTNGLLSIEALKDFVLHEPMSRVPLIMELPVVEESVEKEMLDIVRSWH